MFLGFPPGPVPMMSSFAMVPIVGQSNLELLFEKFVVGSSKPIVRDDEPVEQPVERVAAMPCTGRDIGPQIQCRLSILLTKDFDRWHASVQSPSGVVKFQFSDAAY